MRAAGRTLRFRELTEDWIPKDAAIYVTDGKDWPNSRPNYVHVRESRLHAFGLEIIVDTDALASGKEDDCKELLQRFLEKELNASELRKEAKELLENKE